MYEIRE